MHLPHLRRPRHDPDPVILLTLGFAAAIVNPEASLHPQPAAEQPEKPEVAVNALAAPARITATLPENILDAKQAATIALDYTPGDEQTWYFDHDGNPTETASPGGYYRKALGQTADGRRVVQGRVEVFGDGIGGGAAMAGKVPRARSSFFMGFSEGECMGALCCQRRHQQRLDGVHAVFCLVEGDVGGAGEDVIADFDAVEAVVLVEVGACRRVAVVVGGQAVHDFYCRVVAGGDARGVNAVGQ